jgi:hypothetical protein
MFCEHWEQWSNLRKLWYSHLLIHLHLSLPILFIDSWYFSSHTTICRNASARDFLFVTHNRQHTENAGKVLKFIYGIPFQEPSFLHAD